MVILCFDPGLRTGYAVIDYSRQIGASIRTVGVIEPPERRPRGIHGAHLLRARVLHEADKLRVDYSPDEIAWEERAYVLGGTALAAQGAYSAIAEIAEGVNERRFARGDGKRWGAYSPIEVRNSLFGSPGKRSASEVRQAVETAFGLSPRFLTPDAGNHKTDALAVALCHLARAHGCCPRHTPRRSRVAQSTLDRITAAREAAIRGGER